MIDVKKLITGFLILAIALGASALIVSTVGNSVQATGSEQAQVQATISDTPTSSNPVQNNAFVVQSNNQVSAAIETAAANAAAILATTSAPLSDSSNLTDALADSYLGGVIGTNPNGPTYDTNGDPVLTQPDVTGIVNVVANSSATQELQIPDWDIEAASQPVRIAAASNPAAVESYGKALEGVLSAHIDDRVKSILNNSGDADTSDLAYIQSQMQQTLGDTLALQTPSQLVPFQKDMVKIFVYDKNFFQLLTLAQTDPVKASLIFQTEDSKFQLAEQKLQEDSQAIANNAVSLQGKDDSQNGLLAIVDNILGIPTAHAQWQVFDPATWTLISTNQLQNIEQQLEDAIKNTLLQILKNVLIALVQRKVLVWIQGSGAPRFITNWSTQLVTAYTQRAITYINSQYGPLACGYPGLLPQISVMLKLPYSNGNNSCANTFQAALSGHTLQQFYNNFSQGGWLAFGAGSAPTNNYYDSLYFGSIAVGLNARNAQQAVQAKSIASQGGKGDQVCADGSNPNGISYYCTDPSGKDYTSNSPCPANNLGAPEAEANNGTCANGAEPNGTTPGIFTINSEQSSAEGTTQQLAAANAIVGLLNAVTGSLLTGLENAAVSAAGNAVNGMLSINPTSIQGGGTPPAQMPLSCIPTQQTVNVIGSSTPPATIGAAGGTFDSSGNYPTYNWASSDGASSTGSTFSHVFNPGTYTVTLSDTASDTPVTCSVTVQQ